MRNGMAGTTVGRPWDAAIDDAVLRATCELLELDGYLNLSIAKIAERAGTTKPALYRRWKTKAHLVHEAVFPAPDPVVLEEAIDLRTGIRAMVKSGLELLGRPAARAALPGLLAETTADASLATEVLGRAAAPAVDWLHDHVRPGVAAATVFELVAGAAFMATATRQPTRRRRLGRRSRPTSFLRGIAP